MAALGVCPVSVSVSIRTMKEHRIPILWSRISKGRTCWQWQGTTSKGYGLFWDGERTQVAHRVVYELLNGQIAAGLTLDHLCRNRSCVRPKHMEPVTNRVNILRGEGITARLARRTHCPNGHAYSAENTRYYQGRRYCRACRRKWNRSYEQRPEVKERLARQRRVQYHQDPEPHRKRAREYQRRIRAVVGLLAGGARRGLTG